ncbi:MAG: SDR family oxidoreductase [Roseiflexaceae bacterium]
MQYRGKTALVTGASSGIGAAFAQDLAKRGMNLILVARSVDKLNALAQELSQRYQVQAVVLPADLGQVGAAEKLLADVEQRGLGVDLLINNAGFATHGAFEQIELQRDRQQVMVNVTALVDLTHAFMPQLIERRGAVINVASTVAFQPVPYMAVYGATKAFVISLTTALAEEYRSRGVRFLALCPGATATGFFEVAGSDTMAFGAMRTSPQVVATALNALERGKTVVIDGFFNMITAVISKRLPFSWAARIAGQITRPQPTATTATQPK